MSLCLHGDLSPSPTCFLSNEVLLSGGLLWLVLLQLVIKLYSSVDIWIKTPAHVMRLQEVLITRVSVLAAGGEDWHSLTYSRDCYRLKSQVLRVGGLMWSRPIRTACSSGAFEDPSAC